MTASAAPAVLIAALSGRALAACARRGGYRPLVADVFGDLDTRQLAEASERVNGSLARGFAQRPLLAALERLAAGRDVIGLVTGSGFEDRPALLRALAARYPLLGNTADTVSAIKDPFRFAALCAASGVRHPEISRTRPAEGAWLRKRAGGSGGTHIAAAQGHGNGHANGHANGQATERDGWYYQRRVAGTPVAVAFLAAGGACRVLGLSRQWVDPAPRQAFRYGGAARPASVTARVAAAIGAAVIRLVARTQLRGLNSADFLVGAEDIHLLEVNPRPGATLDLFSGGMADVFRWHVDACLGVLPAVAPVFPGGAAAATVYAPAPICLRAGFAWPDWAADRQAPDETVAAGAPFCTVLAEADDAVAAERLVRARTAEILARAGGVA